MIFKNLTALCRSHKRIILYGDAEERVQWLGDGCAAYPLHGMPPLTEAVLATVCDVPGKDLGKFYIRQEPEMPDIYSCQDVDPRGETMLHPEPYIFKRYDKILCPVRTSCGLMFYDPEYLKPLRDMQDTLEIYERFTSGGRLYFAVKSGFLLQAILTPLEPAYDKILQELLELCSALQRTVEGKAIPEEDEDDRSASGLMSE